MVNHVCSVCGCVIENENFIVACSPLTAITNCYCQECFIKGMEPYGQLVDVIASTGKYPDDINKTYIAMIKKQLNLWNISEKKFIQDVENAIEYDYMMRNTFSEQKKFDKSYVVDLFDTCEEDTVNG